MPFRGLQYEDHVVEDWTEPGWTGSRGDILRALTALVTDGYDDLVHIEFGCKVSDVDVHAGTVTYTPWERGHHAVIRPRGGRRRCRVSRAPGDERADQRVQG
jgi:hypothetical protein